MKKNITRVDALNTAIDLLDAYNDQFAETDAQPIIEVLTNIRDSISKANGRKSDKPTKTQVENAGIKDNILAVMSHDGMTIGDISTALGGEYTSQKVMALVRQLIQSGKVERYEDKRKALFRLV